MCRTNRPLLAEPPHEICLPRTTPVASLPPHVGRAVQAPCFRTVFFQERPRHLSCRYSAFYP
ncbi:hypothetical protein E2C01_026455 [Portunus trituberculatus]|uniref:Uncharacterized protein n=1 Tax=Portunus trituberculatus TaxID=210409 RepID=A0A5B7EJ80_PORTR|nr:hypothetical protein [Portunus trituberculatus]